MKNILMALCFVMMLRVSWGRDSAGIVIGSYYDNGNSKPYLLVRTDDGLIQRVEHDRVTGSRWVDIKYIPPAG